jgi:predicted amidohydrolase
VKIALAQLAASPDRAANLDRALGAMTAAHEAGAELIAFPEVVLDPAFQNGYFAALANPVGPEAGLHFAGESFAVDPEGRVIARGKSLEEDLVIAEVDLAACAASTARRLFWRDRRPELYRDWVG